VSIADSVSPGATIFTPTFSDSNSFDTHTFTHAGSLSSYFTYKEHAIIVMIMLCMFILGDRFIKAIIACFRILSVFTMFDVLYILIIFLINIVKTVNI
jgi:hypothetical protein